MDYMWEKLPEKNGMERFVLVHKETGRPVMEVHLSSHGTYKQNSAVRNRIKRAYELYSAKVWFSKWKFF